MKYIYHLVVLVGIGALIAAFVFLKGRTADAKRKALIRLYGPAGINYYAHLECEQALRTLLEGKKPASVIAKEQRWTPAELIGRFTDITACDACKKEFAMTDKGYVSFWCTNPRELQLLREIEAEKHGADPAARTGSLQ
ncbi:hypothetical protein BWI17_12350 [Betaproteobacteria bacterium GR16-43]|nr:hypothetical protein BWI17_12350 [Betaproteobacteria bacterium GR16-43]